MGYFDFLTKRHELKRLDDPTKVNKENCEWKIEPVEASMFYTIKNQAHDEPIFAESINLNSKVIRRKLSLKHRNPALLTDNYQWIIDCE